MFSRKCTLGTLSSRWQIDFTDQAPGQYFVDTWSLFNVGEEKWSRSEHKGDLCLTRLLVSWWTEQIRWTLPLVRRGISYWYVPKAWHIIGPLGCTGASTRCDLMMQCGTDLGWQWFRLWLIAWWNQVITGTNADDWTRKNKLFWNLNKRIFSIKNMYLKISPHNHGQL